MSAGLQLDRQENLTFADVELFYKMGKNMISWMSKYESQVKRLSDEIIVFFHRSNRPVFLGEISTFINKNIELTEELVEELVTSNVIRKATIEEIFKVGGRFDSCVLVLVGNASPKLAHRP